MRVKNNTTVWVLSTAATADSVEAYVDDDGDVCFGGGNLFVSTSDIIELAEELKKLETEGDK